MAADRMLPIDLRHVMLQFARRGAAQPFLYQEVGARMAQRLDVIKLDPIQIVDAGCGAGHAVPLLHARYPKARIMGIDHASRIAQARQAWPTQGLRALLRTRTGGARVAWRVQDFCEAGPPVEHIDLLWSLTRSKNCAMPPGKPAWLMPPSLLWTCMTLAT
jgi:malonyl-CoA O-methyltransferase